ncbi:hypothetical protein SPHINGOT1_660033 [Sphingomonas sp. T1]|nr:hypothetical protein SPHINGOT1_660033 [Sphingomonas sp. T1]
MPGLESRAFSSLAVIELCGIPISRIGYVRLKTKVLISSLCEPCHCFSDALRYPLRNAAVKDDSCSGW